MPRNFLSNRLMTAKRFAPVEVQVPAAPTATPPDDLERLLQVEQQTTRAKVVQRDAAETIRRRDEIRRDLAALVASLRDEQEAVAEKLARFSALEQRVAQLSAQDDPGSLAEVKRAVREAHLEMVVHYRDGLAQEGAASSAWNPAELSFGQLARLGLGLTWPLLLGLLLAALIVAVALSTVFGVP